MTKDEIKEVEDKQEKLKKKKEEVLLKIRMAGNVKNGTLKMEDYEKALRKELTAR